MKTSIIFVFAIYCVCSATAQEAVPYRQNLPPLAARPYLKLPLGAIQPQGWLLQQLQTMAQGLTGHLDERYEKVVGPRNGWLGGDGDGWERGPYWIDGLLPLSYILNDQALIEKTKPWIEWTLTSQRPDGYFGPQELDHPEPEPGLQKTMRRDWWPKMVMLRVLMQYYSATGDGRVIQLMRRYFQYQLKQLPKTPLDHWTIWANRRGGDNLMAVYWLYNHTGDSALLELGDLLFEQTFPWTRVFLNDRPADLYHSFPAAEPWLYGSIRYPWKNDQIDALSLKDLRTFHCVNIAQGLKQPVVYYQQPPDERYLNSVRNALEDLRRYHGQPQGMFGGDEPLHGPSPTQGIELCSVVEMMFSLETILAITGDVAIADQLEKIAYNALP
ncbi:glycoside hydrolase family 127 protein, partial [candidate division KSB1 bacterium]|nr:glycoside hydrolase family 127 protein [candidate division KSB1 bacterium]